MKFTFKILLLLASFPLNTNAQVDGLMYWEIRQRFLDKFIRVGEGHGMSIPVTWIKKQEQGPDILVFEDESTRQLGWYIAMLATEHEVLQYFGYPTEQTKLEIYYAFKAIRRLDGYAEFLWNRNKPESDDVIYWDSNTNEYKKESGNTALTDYTNTNMNGFLIRQDVPPHFEALFDVDGPYTTQHQAYNTDNTWIVDNQIQGVNKTVMSQDQFFHLMFGMSFVKRFMGGISYNGMNFVDEAKAFCSRVMINYNGAYNLRNPVIKNNGDYNPSLDLDGCREVEDLEGHNIGNSSFYAWFVATMANWFINGVEYSGLPIISDAQDADNPFMFDPAFLLSKTAWVSLPFILYPVNSLKAPNQIMLQLLICMSRAYGIGSRGLLDLNPEVFFHNPGYRLYATAYRLLHNDDVPIGYSKQEMEEMLNAMTCEGSFRYTTVSSPGNFISMHNSVWNMDNIFVQAPDFEHEAHTSGHYNGLDYMLLYNVYQILTINNAVGFEIDNVYEFAEDFTSNAYCGAQDCELNGTVPAIYQDYEMKQYLDLNPFDENFWNYQPIHTYTSYGSVHQIGTQVLPYIRSSVGEITINQKYKHVTKTIYQTNINTNQNPPVTYSSNPVTYSPVVSLRATKGFSSGTDFETDYNISLSMEPGSDLECYANYYSPRFAEGASRLRYQVFDRTPGKKNAQNATLVADVQLFPNPAGDVLNFTF
jgi:hypothetical protein